MRRKCRYLMIPAHLFLSSASTPDTGASTAHLVLPSMHQNGSSGLNVDADAAGRSLFTYSRSSSSAAGR